MDPIQSHEYINLQSKFQASIKNISVWINIQVIINPHLDTIQVFYDQVFFDQVFSPTLIVSINSKKTWTYFDGIQLHPIFHQTWMGINLSEANLTNLDQTWIVSTHL